MFRGTESLPLISVALIFFSSDKIYRTICDQCVSEVGRVQSFLYLSELLKTGEISIEYLSRISKYSTKEEKIFV